MIEVKPSAKQARRGAQERRHDANMALLVREGATRFLHAEKTLRRRRPSKALRAYRRWERQP